MADVVLVEHHERVATVTLNRPEARNALSQELRRALWKTIGDLDADDGVAAIVLTGADPAFCAGLDLKELAEGGEALSETGATGDESTTRGPIPAITTPLIGAINGVAITGGFEVALACDFLVASERARFADTHARVGIMPGWGLTVLLPEAVGLRRARELSATGNFLDAETALAWGLVNHVVPPRRGRVDGTTPGRRHRLERRRGGRPHLPHVPGGLARDRSRGVGDRGPGRGRVAGGRSCTGRARSPPKSRDRARPAPRCPEGTHAWLRGGVVVR